MGHNLICSPCSKRVIVTPAFIAEVVHYLCSKSCTVYNGKKWKIIQYIVATNTDAQPPAFSDMPFCITSLYGNKWFSSKNSANTTKYNNIPGNHFLGCRLLPVVVDHAKVSSDVERQTLLDVARRLGISAVIYFLQYSFLKITHRYPQEQINSVVNTHIIYTVTSGLIIDTE